MSEARNTSQRVFDIPLRLLPTPHRLLFSAVLCTLGTGYLFAIMNLALAVGLTPAKVVEHYWGNEATQQAMKAEKEAKNAPAAPVKEEELSFDAPAGAAEEASSGPILAVPSFPSLVAESHFHLFGFTFIFFLLGLIMSFAELPGRLKNLLILAPFVASVFDVWSILLTRFVGPYFAWMLMTSGSVMGLSFTVVFFIGMYQMWFKKAPTVEAFHGSLAHT